MPETTQIDNSAENQPQWRPLDSYQRRVIGVLIEKSKTTPGSYPLTLNSITTACNQKSNRNPQMNIASDDVELVLDQLREMKAVVEIHGDGRVPKYKHTMYQWLGVSKTEIAVMGELLLRGEQTVGELRARASRMEPIAGMSELKPILDELVQRKLVVELTPAGRGQIVTHNLYSETELTQIRGVVSSTSDPPAPAANTASENRGSAAANRTQMDEMAATIELLKNEIAALKQRMDQLEN